MVISMYEEISVKGIVLATSLIKEYDKRMVVLTAELGKITVFANGVRRPGSRYSAVCQSFAMAEFKLRQGRDAYTLVSAEIKESFREIALDMVKMCYASYMCELTAYYTHVGEQASQELNLLYVSFKALLNDNIKNELIKTIFELRFMYIEGQGINVFSCTVCGKQENLTDIDIKRGGLICTDCIKKLKRSTRKISSSAIYTMKYIMSSKLSKLYSFRLSEELYNEISGITDAFMEKYVDRNFNSLDILKTLG